jgi:hypothetical protein
MNETAESPVQESPEKAPTESGPVAAIRHARKLISVKNPVEAWQTLVANTSQDYLVTLHKLLTTVVECTKKVV